MKYTLFSFSANLVLVSFIEKKTLKIEFEKIARLKAINTDNISWNILR